MATSSDDESDKKMPAKPHGAGAQDGKNHPVAAASEDQSSQGSQGSQGSDSERPRKRKAEAQPNQGPEAIKGSPSGNDDNHDDRLASAAHDQPASLPSYAPAGVARAAGTEGHGRTGDDAVHPDEIVPENETAEEKRLRTNRINERQKRARQALKIDYFMEEHHNFLAANKAMKKANDEIRTKIAAIRRGELDPSTAQLDVSQLVQTLTGTTQQSQGQVAPQSTQGSQLDVSQLVHVGQTSQES